MRKAGHTVVGLGRSIGANVWTRPKHASEGLCSTGDTSLCTAVLRRYEADFSLDRSNGFLDHCLLAHAGMLLDLPNKSRRLNGDESNDDAICSVHIPVEHTRSCNGPLPSEVDQALIDHQTGCGPADRMAVKISPFSSGVNGIQFRGKIREYYCLCTFCGYKFKSLEVTEPCMGLVAAACTVHISDGIAVQPIICEGLSTVQQSHGLLFLLFPCFRRPAMRDKRRCVQILRMMGQ